MKFLRFCIVDIVRLDVTDSLGGGMGLCEQDVQEMQMPAVQRVNLSEGTATTAVDVVMLLEMKGEVPSVFRQVQGR